MDETITVSTAVQGPIEKVWHAYTDPTAVTQWNFASPDWECPKATSDLRVGGAFSSRMQSKDGTQGFDFGGTYTAIELNQRIEYTMGDKREAVVTFQKDDGSVILSVTFEKEHENPEEMQRAGWQAILNNFKQYVESH